MESKSSKCGLVGRLTRPDTFFLPCNHYNGESFNHQMEDARHAHSPKSQAATCPHHPSCDCRADRGCFHFTSPPRRPFVLCHAKTKAGTRTRAGMSQDKQRKAAKGADSSYSTQHLRRQMRCWPPPDNLHCPPLGLFIMVITSLGTHPRHLTAETSSQFTPSSCHTPRGAQVRSLESLK